MISKPLFAREWKSNYKIIIIFALIISMYEIIVIALFDPKLGESFKMLSEALPELFAFAGMVSFSPVLVEFIAELLYGFILIAFPLVMILLLNNRLVVRYVDRGAMAYLLATPNSRKKIIITQVLFSYFSNLILVVYTVILGIIASAVLFPQQLDLGKYLLLNLGWFCLLTAISGLSFCADCIFNDGKYANGIGGGLCIIFVLLKMLSQINEKAKVFSYFTPITLFDAFGLIGLQMMAILKSIILLISGIVLYVVGVKVFCKKDISL